MGKTYPESTIRDLLENSEADEVPLSAKPQATVKSKKPAASKTSHHKSDIKSKYLTDREVAARYGVHRTTIWRWVKRNDGFPAPLRLSAGCARWRETDLKQHERRAGRQVPSATKVTAPPDRQDSNGIAKP